MNTPEFDRALALHRLVVEAAAVAYIFDLAPEHALWKALAPYGMTKEKLLARHGESITSRPEET